MHRNETGMHRNETGMHRNETGMHRKAGLESYSDVIYHYTAFLELTLKSTFQAEFENAVYQL
jgi:hypothetical protein